MTPATTSRSFRAYIACVTVLGLALYAFLTVHAGGRVDLSDRGSLLVLALLLTVSEQCPLTVHRLGDRNTITLSAIFACAMLLRWDLVVVVTVQALACVMEDVVARRTWWKSAFNVAQYTLSLSAAGLLYHSLQPAHAILRLDGAGVLAAVAAGCVFFVTNTVLAATPVALLTGVPVRRFLLQDFAFQASVNGAMVALAPVVIAAVDQSLWLVPLLLLPAVAVYQGARVSLDKEHRARHDALTELPNRVLFAELAAVAIADATRAKRRVGVIMMDLDSFKELNDTLGHSAGDELLRQIGPRLAPALGPNDTLARMGGDEFAILLRGIEGVADARAAVDRVVAQLEEPFDIEASAFDLRASLGIAVFPEHGQAVEELVQHADVAMYGAKRSRSGYDVYDAERNHYSRRRLTLLNELRPAMARGELVVHYQPKADMRTGRICGMEALVRWRHPQLGMIPPIEFIGLAEQTGLIRPLTEYVLDATLAQQRAWSRLGPLVPVSVNLSARVVNDVTLPARIAARLRHYGLPPSALVVELTETALMAEPERSLQVLHELCGIGVRLSIDDFGTGYSSLAYLGKLPVDEIKIDRSFVSKVDTSTSDHVIVQSTIELARNLGLVVVAEGVETIPVWQTLARLGCNEAQGYLIARPEPADSVTPLLARDRVVPLVDEFAVNFGVNAAQA